VSVLPGGPEETYVVVTHREGGRARLADLAGTKLGIFGNPRLALAEPWLDVELAAAGLPRANAHFSSLQRHQKPAKAVLPVFFGQAEAALVSQRVFETIVELNPQLGRTLQVIARSPALLPMIFALVEGIDPALHRQLLENLPDVHRSPAGRQVLHLMQGERLELVAPERYDSAWALLAAHRRAVGGATGTGGPVR
jgi:ABC-type phosphate/phosphonate transport system substrate-binding protein